MKVGWDRPERKYTLAINNIPFELFDDAPMAFVATPHEQRLSKMINFKAFEPKAPKSDP